MTKPYMTRLLVATLLIWSAVAFPNAAQVPSGPPETAGTAPLSDGAGSLGGADVLAEQAEQYVPPVAIEELSESRSGIVGEIRSLEQSLIQRQAALEKIQERQKLAKAWLDRLDAEYHGFERRLDTAGLGLTRDYANLLRRRLDRLERQHLADNLAATVKTQIEAARIEQFRLEELGAVPQAPAMDDNRLIQRRSALLNELGVAVAAHLDSLTQYFVTINETQERILAYQALLRQRLFWLPSADPFNADAFGDLFTASAWLLSPSHWRHVVESVPVALQKSPVLTGALIILLSALFAARSLIWQRLVATGRDIGNVGRDHLFNTFLALGYSILLALVGSVALALAAVLVMPAGDFGAALAAGFVSAAFVFFLLNMVYQVARQDGLGQRHFKWRLETLSAIRREMPRLMLIVVPAAALTPLTESAIGEPFRDSLGRLVFVLASMSLAFFAHRILRLRLVYSAEGRASVWSRTQYILIVSMPLVLMAFSLFGYHYTAVQMEGTLFITACWIALVALLYYVGLRALSVSERRLALQRLKEKRAAEQEIAATREAEGAMVEGLPTTLDLPEMDLHAISTQSNALLRIFATFLIATGLWLLWANVFPAFRLLDEITVWTIAPLSEGGPSVAITLENLVLSFLLVIATVLAARNLPGTLEVVVLSRMNLAPGTGYAITTLVTYIIVIIGVVASLSMIGAQWSKLQWLVAALGVGLGFGLQEIVANFVSGIIILFERPVRVGDTVTVGGKTGTVARIRIRATTLIDWDRKEQIVPNKTFVTQDLTNWTLTDSITRVIVRVGVAYGSDIDQVQALLSEVAVANERVVKDPSPAVFCVALSDSSINFELRVFVKSMGDIMPLSHELHSAITQSLRSAGVEIPFPQRDIHIRTAN
jgi:potassium efflux system protein